MRLRIQCEGVSDEQQLARQIERSLYLSVGRYLSEVRTASVRLQAYPGVASKRHNCHVSLRTTSGSTVTSEFEFEDVTECIAHATASVARALRLDINRLHQVQE